MCKDKLYYAKQNVNSFYLCCKFLLEYIGCEFLFLFNIAKCGKISYQIVQRKSAWRCVYVSEVS